MYVHRSSIQQVQSNSGSLVLILDLFNHFEHNMSFHYKSKTVTFTHYLMSVIMYNFRKILLNRFRENSKLSILDPKILHQKQSL